MTRIRVETSARAGCAGSSMARPSSTARTSSWSTVSGACALYYFPLRDVRTDVLLASADRGRRSSAGRCGSTDTPSKTSAGRMPTTPTSSSPCASTSASTGEDRSLVRGGRRSLRPSARSLPPGRRAEQLAARQGRARRRSGRRDASAAAAVRNGAAHALLHPDAWTCGLDLLEPSSTSTQCPYKGNAVYWCASATPCTRTCLVLPVPDRRVPQDPNLLAFYNEKVDLYVDGQLEPK